MGLDYEEVIGTKRWTKERVKDEVQARIDSGKSLRRQDIERDDKRLLSAMVKQFGSFKYAAKACGIDYEQSLGFTWWDREKVAHEFKRIYESKQVRTVSEIREMNRGLDHAIRKYYGGYDDLCSELGVDVTLIRPEVYEWKAEDLLCLLRDMRDEGVPLNILSVSSRMPSVYKVAKRHFGGFDEALQAIGEDIDDHFLPHVSQSKMGFEFENLLSEMFDALNKGYERHCRRFNGIIPDFYDAKRGVIIDAKLSSWTVFNCNTIEKYAPYCKSLNIVYLRGKPISHKIDNLTLTHVSEYYDELRSKGLSKFITSFEELLSETDTRAA